MISEQYELDGREFVEDVEESVQTELLRDDYQEIEVFDRICVGSFTEMYPNVSENVKNQEQHIINSVVLPVYELSEENLDNYISLSEEEDFCSEEDEGSSSEENEDSSSEEDEFEYSEIETDSSCTYSDNENEIPSVFHNFIRSN
uniref:(salmon louse) hypothetical protein n=1 Tax=Lepeophtheirus salmonis TaxID=72036 RepID=A0A7R8CMA9_LEPSM